MVAEFQHLGFIVFGLLCIYYGLVGIRQREISFGLRGSAANKHQIVLTGHNAIACSAGVILGGFLLGLPNLLRFLFKLTDAVVSIFDVAGIAIIFASFALTTIFQVAVDVGRELGGQEPREK